MPDLKPCPFCGNREPMYRDELVKEYNSWINAEYVVCATKGNWVDLKASTD